MKKAAWTVYGVSILFLATGRLVWEFGPISLASAVFTLLYVTGLYGYAYRRAIWRAAVWRALFWLNIVVLSLSFLLALLVQTPEQMIRFTAALLFSLPLLYALYRYTLPDGPVVWPRRPTASQ
jgi:hypothetical protein